MACCWTWLAALLLIHSTTTYKLVCHLSNSSQYRPKEGRFELEDLDPFLCTHIVFDFAFISHDNKLTENELSNKIFYGALNQLKNRNPELKTLLSVRDSRTNESKFSQMVFTSNSRQVFIMSSIAYLRTYGFDGLELDWDHPGKDKYKFTQLCKELLLAFDKENIGAQEGTRWMLSASLTPLKDVFTLHQYEVKELAKILDFVSVKTFDLSSGTVAAHHSPLYSSDNANIDYIIQYWLEQKAPTKNLLLGFPVHARSYTLATGASSPGAPVIGPGPPGPYTQEMGFWSYYETCSFLKGASFYWIEKQYVPYAVRTRLWVGFDNKNSYGSKVTYLKSHHLGGAAVWSIDLDDFSGNFCNQGKYPMISHLKTELGELNNTTPTKPETGQTTDRPHSTSSATDGGSGEVDPSCFHNITVEYPDPSLCKGRADGRYQTPQEPPFTYTCALGKAYVIECPPVHGRGSTASRDGFLLSLLLTILHHCCVYR